MTLARLEKLAETDSLFFAKEADNAGPFPELVLCFASAPEERKIVKDNVKKQTARSMNSLRTDIF